MNYRKNIKTLSAIDKVLTEKFCIKKGLNKKNEAKRLVFEILKKYNYTVKDFLNLKDINDYLKTRQFHYHYLKKILIKLRYPYSCNTNSLIEKNIYLPPLKNIPLKKAYQYSGIFYPDKIFIEKSVKNNKHINKILKKFSRIEPVFINKLKDHRTAEEYDIQMLGKNDLFLVEENFDIFKHCPCTKNVLSCGYFILNMGFGCPFDCSYCYLQHYTNFPGIILPVNIEKILLKLNIILKKSKKVLRIGTGEFTDSLVFDDVIPYSNYLIPFFENQRHILELKTKSVNINNLLKIKGNKNVVISWSLNTPTCIKNEEHYTPSLNQRLKAASEVIENGFKVGFHFDPIIYYPDWEKEYKKTIELMFKHAQKNIEWISLGALRFHRTLKQIIEMRYPVVELLNGELLIDPVDSKMRYIEPIRIDIFKKMVKWIRNFDRDVIIYLCMEPIHIWQKVFNTSFEKYQYEKGIYFIK